MPLQKDTGNETEILYVDKKELENSILEFLVNKRYETGRQKFS